MKKKNQFSKGILTLILITITMNVIFFVITFTYFKYSNNSPIRDNKVSMTTSNDNNSTKLTNMIQNVKNGVFTVVNRTKAQSIDGDSIEDFLNWYRDNDETEKKDDPHVQYQDSAIGSGFVFSKSKDKYYLMTNNHVIKDAKEINIMFSDKSRIKAELVGRIPSKDVAVLKFSTNKKISVLTFANSEKIKLGEDVIAIGSPISLDYSNTVTRGIVSKLPFIQKINENESKKVIQTDAAINPGNSGGPLLNTEGHVIGMNTFKRNDAENLGFSLPSNDIKELSKKIIKEGNK